KEHLMSDLIAVAARYVLGLVTPESLVQAADSLLQEGCDTPAAIELVIVEPPKIHDAGPVFEQMLSEQQVELPTKDEAVNILIRRHLQSIVQNGCRPREGLQAMMDEVYWPVVVNEKVNKYVGDSRGLEHLISMYWAYDDLVARPSEVSCAGKYVAEA